MAFENFMSKLPNVKLLENCQDGYDKKNLPCIISFTIYWLSLMCLVRDWSDKCPSDYK